jgi:hypothetical protein
METSHALPNEEPPALKLRRDLLFSFQNEGEEKKSVFSRIFRKK